jgi:folate-binding protein YgfZ
MRAYALRSRGGLTEPATYPIHRSVSTDSIRAAHDAGEQAPAAASGRLPHIGVLRFAGPDAVNFLQGQVSNDTRRLAEGAPLLAAYSSAQGRVIAVLHLVPHSSGVLALLPRDVLAATCERLRKFVLRAKVKIEDASDRLAVIGMLAPEALRAAGLPAPDARGYLERDGIGIARVGPAADRESSRYWTIREAGPAQHGIAPDIETAWRLADIRAGLPTVYAATSEAFVAQMLNLDLIDAISFSKGCYTGQEIIARTQHLGRIKRRMVRLRLAPGEWSLGGSVKLTDGRAGRLIELAPADGHVEALAVLNLEPGVAAERAAGERAPGERAPGDRAPGDRAPGDRAEGDRLSNAVELPLPYSALSGTP